MQCRVSRGLRRLLRCRRGTAEIIGSVMFLLIMLFFFTNVFLWHDNATREMDDVLAEKMNSLVSIQVVNNNVTRGLRLQVTNNGGTGVELSRLWIVIRNGGGNEMHLQYGVTDEYKWVGAGDSVFIPPSIWIDTMVLVGKEVAFKVVTTRGNMAACSCVPVK
jgi:archaellum component FlaF (FlaF/FlaG flagellin family)